MDRTTTYVLIGAALVAFVVWQNSDSKKAAAEAAARKAEADAQREENTGLNGFINHAPQLLGGATGFMSSLSGALGNLNSLVHGSGGSTSFGGALDSNIPDDGAAVPY